MKKKNLLKITDILFHIRIIEYQPKWVVLIFDIFICVLSYYIAILISSSLVIDVNSTKCLLNPFQQAIVVFLLQVVFFKVFHIYSSVLRYYNPIDVTRLLLSVIINVLTLVVVNFIAAKIMNIDLINIPTILFYIPVSLVLFLIPPIITKTIYYYASTNIGGIVPVMIYGTTSTEIEIARFIHFFNNVKAYKLVGFIDDDGKETKRSIMGVKVYHLTDTIIENVLKKTKAIIIHSTKLNEINPERDLNFFINNNLSILNFPTVDIWKQDMIKQIQPFQIENLLERSMLEISLKRTEDELATKTILITGAAGSIGSEIARQVIKFNPRLVVLLDQAESHMYILQLELEKDYPNQNLSFCIGDVRNKNRMEYLMDLYRPDYVFHAAAYKHVPMMENNPIESIQVNVLGTKILADLAVKYNVSRFVMISTDKAVNPTNVMGASKRIAEIYVQSLHRKLEKKNGTTKFITTRFGNVLGSSGSVIPLFKSQIEKGGPVTVTHPEIIRYFMTIPEACTLVLEAGVTGNGGEIFIFDMGNPVKIVNLARKMILLAGYTPEVDIKIEYTGLRPGEKLYEELLNNMEMTIKTHNPKIMIAKVREYEYDLITKQIDELIEYSLMCKNYETVAQMKRIVPEFISKNSQYEKLDK